MSTDSPRTDDIFGYKGEVSAVELKGSVFTLPILRLTSSCLPAIDTALQVHLRQNARFFENAPIVIDVELLDADDHLDLPGLNELLRRLNLVPVGLRNANDEQARMAAEAGLAVLKGGSNSSPAGREKPKPVEPQPEVSDRNPVDASALIIEHPVRSGQQIYAQGRDLIVLASVNAGAEVIADGSIHIYSSLRGRALAGVHGNAQARIFIREMEAELIAIAGCFRVFEEQVPEDIFKKSVQASLFGEKLAITPL